MRQRRPASIVMLEAIVLSFVIAAQAEVSAVPVELVQPMHFLDAEGHELVIPAGTYHIEPRRLCQR